MIKAEFCFSLGEFSAAIMSDRQNNVSYSTLRNQILEISYTEDLPRELTEIFITILDKAFTVPIQKTPILKKKIITEFSNMVINSCFETI
jgi:hypothetical protein